MHEIKVWGVLGLTFEGFRDSSLGRLGSLGFKETGLGIRVRSIPPIVMAP